MTRHVFAIATLALTGAVAGLSSTARAEDPDLAKSQIAQASRETAPLVVRSEPMTTLREEERVGSYNQPLWSVTRRFPGTRIYVIPEGEIEAEFWARPTFNRDGTKEMRNLYEIEIGFPYHFQLDLYYRSDTTFGTDDDKYLNGAQIELRWALADWGKIWGNPTLYFEYAPLEDRANKVESRLLLGDEIAPRWHWGVNLAWEGELSGEREYEYQFSGGVSYTVVDDKFSVGVEGKALFTDVEGDRGNFNEVYLLGPSFQWKPLPQWTINFAPLLGVGPNSPDAELTFNMGWRF